MKKLNAVLFILLLLLPVIISYEVRHYAASLPVTDEWAKSTVYSYYTGQLRAQITSQYPNLQEDQIQNQITGQMNSQIVSTPLVKQQIQDVSQKFKNAYRYDDDKYVYMPNIDPYEYLRKTQEILDHGNIGDAKKADGNWYDMHTVAPNGQRIYQFDLHPMVLAWFYKIGHFFNPDTTVMETSGYLPAVFVSIATIFIFLFLRRYAGDVGASFGALLYGIHPLVLTRTLWANATTESYSVMFIPMAFYFASEMMAREGKIRYLFAGLSGLVLGLFAFAWNQWYYAFDILLGVLGICFLIKAWAVRKTQGPDSQVGFLEALKPTILVISTFILSTCLFVSLFGLGGFRGFIDAPFAAMTNFEIKSASYSNLWPNVYTTVAELAPINFSSIIGLIGKTWLFIALIGFAVALWKKEWFISVSLMLLSLGGIVASLVAGIRFTLFLGLPLAIGVGLGTGYAYEYLNRWLVKLI